MFCTACSLIGTLKTITNKPTSACYKDGCLYGVFNDAVSSSHYVVLNDRKNNAFEKL
jgi:hypothetical protein